MYSANVSSSHDSGFSPGVAVGAGTDLADGARQAESLAEPLVVLLGHAEHVGDGEHRERLGVGADELAATIGDELVELPVGEPPHERLVVLQPPRREQPHDAANARGCGRAGPS